MSENVWYFVSVEEKGRARKAVSVQFRLPRVTVTLAVRNLKFASKALRFIYETRDNPAFLDQHLGGGRYRHMPAKLVDLSGSFLRAKVSLRKCGEFDDRYYLTIGRAAYREGVTFDVSGANLDAMVEGLLEIIENHTLESPPTAGRKR